MTLLYWCYVFMCIAQKSFFNLRTKQLQNKKGLLSVLFMYQGVMKSYNTYICRFQGHPQYTEEDVTKKGTSVIENIARTTTVFNKSFSDHHIIQTENELALLCYCFYFSNIRWSRDFTTGRRRIYLKPSLIAVATQ